MPVTRVIQVPNVTEEINRALYNGYNVFFVATGEKNFGKSTLCTQILYDVYKRYRFDWEQTWRTVFHHLSFTAGQFYGFYIEAKRQIDQALIQAGLDSGVLEMDVEKEWKTIIDNILDSQMTQKTTFAEIREKFRIPAILIDDIAANMNRQDVSIYYDKFFQKLFADFTLIRPYVACILATCPDIDDVPRVILKHVTGIIQCTSQGHAVFRKKKTYIRFKGKSIESFMKLYDGDPITWKPLDPEIYSKYETLRHLMSRQVSQKAVKALEKINQAEERLLK